jgi:hypothetical protein
MCRSIKPLRMPDRPATEQEIQEAALQYVRKVSGYRKPSKANEEAFQMAIDEVADATRKMLSLLPAKQTPAGGWGLQNRKGFFSDLAQKMIYSRSVWD